MFPGFRFPPEMLSLAVRWYLRYGLSYSDIQKPLAERDIDIDQITLIRRVERFRPL